MICVDREDIRLAILEIYKHMLAARLHIVHLTSDLMYLLLVLLQGLVSLEELWDIGLAGYFEHGDSLDGHLAGGYVQLAMSRV